MLSFYRSIMPPLSDTLPDDIQLVIYKYSFEPLVPKYELLCWTFITQGFEIPYIGMNFIPSTQEGMKSLIKAMETFPVSDYTQAFDNLRKQWIVEVQRSKKHFREMRRERREKIWLRKAYPPKGKLEIPFDPVISKRSRTRILIQRPPVFYS